jgi:hypothetical protein
MQHGLWAAMAGIWAVVLAAVFPAADAAPANVTWERSYILQDSLVVPASWAVPCDVRGCADAFRVTWILRTAQEADAIKGLVLSDRTVQVRATNAGGAVTTPRFRDSVAVPYASYGEPRTVCVQVVALRRTLASAATTGCRTIERPDAPPPGVDSIRFDTLPWTFDTLMLDSLVGETDMLSFSLYQYRDYLAPDTGWRTDSIPVESDSAHPYILRVGYRTAPCAFARHIDSTTIIVASVPALVTSPRQEMRRVSRCASRARAEYADRPIRYFASKDLAFWSSDSTVIRVEPFLDERYLRYQLRDVMPPAKSGA